MDNNLEMMEMELDGMETTDLAESEYDVEYVDADVSGGTGLGILIGTALVGGTVALGAFVCKKLKVKEKIRNHKIKSLEKQGYVVYPADEVEIEDIRDKEFPAEEVPEDTEN